MVTGASVSSTTGKLSRYHAVFLPAPNNTSANKQKPVHFYKWKYLLLLYVAYYRDPAMKRCHGVSQFRPLIVSPFAISFKIAHMAISLDNKLSYSLQTISGWCGVILNSEIDLLWWYRPVALIKMLLNHQKSNCKTSVCYESGRLLYSYFSGISSRKMSCAATFTTVPWPGSVK